MTDAVESRTGALYRIRLKGRLDEKWSEWFEMSVSAAGSETILEGTVADQAALHGLLNRIRDLNLSLLSVECIEPEADREK